MAPVIDEIGAIVAGIVPGNVTKIGILVRDWIYVLFPWPMDN
jgi:hypothetical protein